MGILGRSLSSFFLIASAGPVFGAFAIAATASSHFDGEMALEYTRKATSFGERPAGSQALDMCRKWIVGQLQPLKCKLSLDSFEGETPVGHIPMANVIAEFPGTSGRAIVISGHYDTKRIPLVHFVGANDGGSSAGFLLELARGLAATKHPDDIYLVFFDGEEAVNRWTNTDSRYGSRHLAAKWESEGFLAKIRALINVDMIGDRDLDILNDAGSSRSMRTLIWTAAEKLGYARNFRTEESGADDDHVPFVDAGVNAVDLLDLDYGPEGRYWHTAQDTMDKLSAHSLQVVGDVMTEVIQELEKK